MSAKNASTTPANVNVSTTNDLDNISERRMRRHKAIQAHIRDYGGDLEIEDEARDSLKVIDWLIALTPDQVEQVGEIAFHYLKNSPAEKRNYLSNINGIVEYMASIDHLAQYLDKADRQRAAPDGEAA